MVNKTIQRKYSGQISSWNRGETCRPPVGLVNKSLHHSAIQLSSTRNRSTSLQESADSRRRKSTVQQGLSPLSVCGTEILRHICNLPLHINLLNVPFHINIPACQQRKWTSDYREFVSFVRYSVICTKSYKPIIYTLLRS